MNSDIKIPVPKGLNVTFDPPTAPKIKNRGAHTERTIAPIADHAESSTGQHHPILSKLKFVNPEVDSDSNYIAERTIQYAISSVIIACAHN